MSSDFRNGMIAATVFWFSVLVAIGAFGKLFAGETWIVATVASYHYNADKDYEQQNYGLGTEHVLSENWRFASGFYRNSNRIDSTYAFLAWTPLRYGMLRLGLAGGLVSGYEKEPLKVAFPVLAIEGKHLGANITLVPQTKSNAGAIGLQLKVRF